MQTWNWQTVVALVVGQCVPSVGVGVELERMVVEKVLLLVCYVVADSSTAQANQLLSSRAAWSWPRKYKASQHANQQMWSLLQNENLNHEITPNNKWRYDQCSWLLCRNILTKCATNELVYRRLPGHIMKNGVQSQLMFMLEWVDTGNSEKKNL